MDVHGVAIGFGELKAAPGPNAVVAKPDQIDVLWVLVSEKNMDSSSG
jgi:hypothetical protein